MMDIYVQHLGIAYIEPIMMWWDLNDNGPSFTIPSCWNGAPIKKLKCK